MDAEAYNHQTRRLLSLTRRWHLTTATEPAMAQSTRQDRSSSNNSINQYRSKTSRVGRAIQILNTSLEMKALHNEVLTRLVHTFDRRTAHATILQRRRHGAGRRALRHRAVRVLRRTQEPGSASAVPAGAVAQRHRVLKTLSGCPFKPLYTGYRKRTPVLVEAMAEDMGLVLRRWRQGSRPSKELRTII